MEEINVPFELKSRARELGAFFNRNGDRKWYIPDGVSEDKAEALRSLRWEKSQVENPELNCETKAEEPEHLHTKMYAKDFEWERVVRNGNPLELAFVIQKYGLPEKEEMRTDILKIFSYRKPGEYPITYDGMMECSESFANEYSQERVVSLIKSCITGARPYAEEIRDSNLTKEEQALLMFVLPI